MACNDTQKNCQPCQDCPPPTPPVMPRCNVAIPDGVFTNATVTVENGCVTRVTKGVAFSYDPEANCAPPAGGGSGGGLDGEKGDDGKAATIQVGAHNMVGWDQPLRIWNTGTSSAAIFNFNIPESKPSSGGGGGGGGLTIGTAGIEFEDGLLQSVPALWPPVMFVENTADPLNSGIYLTFEKNNSTGVVTPILDTSVLMNTIGQIIAALEGQIGELPAPTPPVFSGKWTDASSTYTINTNNVNNTGAPFMLNLRLFSAVPIPSHAHIVTFYIDGEVFCRKSYYKGHEGSGGDLNEGNVFTVIPAGSSFRWTVLEPIAQVTSIVKILK